MRQAAFAQRIHRRRAHGATVGNGQCTGKSCRVTGQHIAYAPGDLFADPGKLQANILCH